jgi:protein-L-isoaspartate O-methyltransferase
MAATTSDRVQHAHRDLAHTTGRPPLTRLPRQRILEIGTGTGWTAAPDRVIATCSVHTVPYAWVAQTRPGGVILTPWGSTFENSALLRLTVDQAGAAVGSVVDWATFMRLRAQRPVIPRRTRRFRHHRRARPHRRRPR